MPAVIPYIPQQITVHLGAPGASAANVTVPFSDYVKNVASSEIYPTWEEAALRANILAIVSFALNRVYTEFYRSRGYDFDITSSTAYDQFFVNELGDPINDDHIYVNQYAGIPTIDIIHLVGDEDRTSSFYPYWHTMNDNLEQIDPKTLQMVGNVVTSVLYRE